MLINVIPDVVSAAAPLTQVIMNTFNLATQTDADSLISYSEPARVEPITLIDAELSTTEDLNKILATTLNLFSCYYIAAATRSLNVNSLRILRSIDHLKPTRSTMGALAEFAEMSHARDNRGHASINAGVDDYVASNVKSLALESLSLPRYGEMALESNGRKKQKGPILLRNATEKEKAEFNKKAEAEAKKAVADLVTEETKRMNANLVSKSGVDKSKIDYMEAPSLVTGKVFELSASYGKNEAKIQVMVSLDSQVTRSGNIVDIYSIGGEMRSMGERWHGWRSGRLRFVEDIMFGSDLIDKELRIGIHDETGSYLRNRESDSGNRLSALLTGKRSVGTASGIVIMSSRTARKLETEVRGKLSDFETRQKIFKRTFALLILVVDTEYESVTVFHRGLTKVNRLPISEYVKARGKDGGDVTEIVKLFLNGSAPTL